MTIQYQTTARLNGTPLARHIDTPEKPAITYESFDALMSAWKADARRTRERTANQNMRETKAATIADDQILELLRRQPDLTAAQIAKYFKRKQCSFATRLSAMANRKQLTVSWISSQTGNHKIRQFRAAKIQPAAIKKGTPRRTLTATRQRTIFFILSNPGCSTRDVAAHLKCTTKNAINRIADARNHEGYTITTHAAGGNKPARHWVKAEEQTDGAI